MSQSEDYTGAGGHPRPRLDFDFDKENQTEYLWETRVPGTDAEETWDSGTHEFKTLADAVKSVLPYYAEFRLTLPEAAYLCLRLGLILGTGVPIDESISEDI